MVYKNKNGNNVEKKVLDIILDHARLVSNGSKALANLIDCWKTPGREEFNSNLKKIDELEAKANSLKKSAIKELTDAGPTLIFRQDMISIIRTTDHIIDLAQGAAFFLNKLNCEWIPPENITDNFQKISDNTIRVTNSLLKLIRALFQSLDKVIEISEEIDMTENQVDTYYRTLIIDLAQLDGEAPVGTALLIREAVDRVEDMVDAAGEAASVIRNYAMSR
jgi:predicted phosphate transport protein (TIGR00153 family)